jgi:6-phosphogluconolactonase (cycloisomerase 2 family)
MLGAMGAGQTFAADRPEAPVGRPAARLAQTEAAGQEARFVYIGSYTRGAPGGWSEVAAANPPEGVAVFAVGPGMGDLALVQTVPSDNPSFVAIHPSQDYLYVVNEIADYEDDERGSIEAYAIDDETGELTLLNTVSCATIPAHLMVSPDGSYLALATYVGGTYELFPIGEDGSLEEASSVAQQEGSGPTDRQGSPHAHCVAFDPSGQYIAGADLGTDTIKIFSDEGGELTEVSAAQVAEGSGPRHLAFHPDGTVLYVINELTATITSFAFDADSGELGDELQTIATVPQNFPAHKSTAELIVHPSGNFLYGSNRKFENHALADSIVAYRIADDKTLRLIGYTTQDLGFPRGFTIDPTGTWLYAMGQKSDSIVQFAIDPGSGALTPTGFSIAAMVPVSMAFKV